MSDIHKTDLCIIGAGSGGLSLAAGAVQMGASVTLIEKGKMGGDCLNYGCVPSKALLAAGKVAHTVKTFPYFGLVPQRPQVDFQRVHDHVHGVMAKIEPHDSQERFESLGVKVIREKAEFIGKRQVQAGNQIVQAKKIIVATGSSPFIPPIDGLGVVPYFTNETIFDQKVRPEHLIVIGGGPIGIEMAQAHRRLGSHVTVLTGHTILPKDDPDVVDYVRRSLQEDGVVLYEGARVAGVQKDIEGVKVFAQLGAQKSEIKVIGTHLLVATGRKANVDGLNLEAAKINYTPRGIQVNDRLQTSNRHVYAIGDCAGGYQFTHVAGYHAGIAIRNILFKLPAKSSMKAAPWVTYSDPELAHVGLTELDAQKAKVEYKKVTWNFEENDRAQAEHATKGLIKVLTKKNGVVLGASIVGKNAGELLAPWILAVSEEMKIGKIASMIMPYPTFSEVSKRVAGSYFTPQLFSEKTKRLVRFLMKFS